MPLKDYESTVGMAAAICTIGQFFSPCFMCLDIIKKKSSEDVDPTPFIGGMGMSCLMLQYSLILKDPAMIPVNIIGFLLNFIYFSIHYYYSKEKNPLLMSCAKTVAGAAILIGYANYDNSDRAETVFGIMVTLLLFALMGAPLLSIKDIMRTKSTAGLPFPLILSGTVVTCLWFLYGVIIENFFVIFQNLVGFSLMTIQLSLFVIYPQGSALESIGSDKKKL